MAAQEDGRPASWLRAVHLCPARVLVFPSPFRPWSASVTTKHGSVGTRKLDVFRNSGHGGSHKVFRVRSTLDGSRTRIGHAPARSTQSPAGNEGARNNKTPSVLVEPLP